MTSLSERSRKETVISNRAVIPPYEDDSKPRSKEFSLNGHNDTPLSINKLTYIVPPPSPIKK